ncbi:FG-GAP repeat protein [Myxococcota bacterium]|nr:FG-GAP repeat protein [Myxococcota bacterium]
MWLWLLACAGSSDPLVLTPVVDAARLTIEGPEGALIGGVYNLGPLDGAPGDELGLAVSRGTTLSDGADLYIFSGGREGALTLDDADQVIVNDEGAWWIVDGGQCTPEGAAGHRNAVGLGDLDGDGLGELMLAFGDDAGEGVVYLLTGAQRAASRETPLSTAELVLFGPGDTFALGTDLAVGDYDGDGLKDVVIGAPVTASPERAGEIAVVYGFLMASARGGRRVLELGGVGWSTVTGELSGERVLSVGDVDRDDRDDLAILAPGCASGLPGRVLVVSGAALPRVGRNERLLVAATYQSGAVLRGNLQRLPDLDGVGQDELIVGGDTDEHGDRVLVFSGEDLLSAPSLRPKTSFQIGANSRSQLTTRRLPGGEVELVSHDGDQLVRVRDPERAVGWHKVEGWAPPCLVDDRPDRHRLLDAVDHDGDGLSELVTVEPLWPTCDEDSLNRGLVIVW